MLGFKAYQENASMVNIRQIFEITLKCKKIIVLCPYCGHLYSWLAEPYSDDDDACSLEVCDYCTKLYYIGPTNKLGCLGCDGRHCSGYEKSYMESRIVDVTAEEKERGSIIIIEEES